MKLSKRLRKRLPEALLAALLILDLAWWHTRAVAWVCALLLLAAYLWYRREAALNAARAAPLRRQMHLSHIRRLENDYTRRDDFNTQAKRAALRSPLDRYYYHGRYRRVQRLLDGHLAGCRQVLDLGCGFGRNARYMREALNLSTVGLDLDELKLFESRRTAAPGDGRPFWLCGDAGRPPFRDGAFDGILCTEVLEHLIDPAAGLAACRRLLAGGGRLLLTVPSRHDLDYTPNPFKLLEKVLSRFTDRVLPPYHHLHAQFEFNWRRPEPAYGVHHHFSWQRIKGLLADAGFRVRWRGSFEIEWFPYLLIEWLSRGDTDRIRRIVDPLEALSTRLPLIGLTGQHLLIVAQKAR